MQTKINWYYYARKQSVTCTDAIGRITVLFDVRIIFMKVLNGARDLVLEIILTCLVRLFNVVKSSIRCRDPSPRWYVARIAIRSDSIRTPQEDTWRTPYPGPPGGTHGTLKYHTRGDALSYPDILSGSLTVASKPCRVIPDSLPQPTFRCLQSERTGAMASRLPRSLTAACRVMMALPPPWGHHDKPKSLPTIKEGGRASDTI